MNMSRGELRTSTNSVVLMIRKRNDELSDNNFYVAFQVNGLLFLMI